MPTPSTPTAPPTTRTTPAHGCSTTRSPPEARNAIRHLTRTVTPGQAEQAEQYARTKQWQTEQVDVDEMKARVMAADPSLADFGGSFDHYHQWYLAAGPVPDHGASRWPVIEHHPGDTREGYLDDGWHRFHSYVRAGDSTIPLIRQRQQH